MAKGQKTARKCFHQYDWVCIHSTSFFSNKEQPLCNATTTVYSASSCDDRQIDYQRSVMIGRCMPTGTSSRQWLCNNATAELHLYNYSSSVDCRGDAGILEAAPLDRCEAGQTAAVMATSDSCIGANKAQLSKACSADLPAYLLLAMLWLSLYHRGIF